MVPIHNTPLTSSEERMHLIDGDAANCWCGPNVLMVGGVITEVDHRDQLQVGDRVAVDDPALAQIQEIFRKATGEEPPPNNVGTVDEVYEDGTLVINFDDGGAAPYPASQTRRIA